jgi:hypothetical protein
VPEAVAAQRSLFAEQLQNRSSEAIAFWLRFCYAFSPALNSDEGDKTSPEFFIVCGLIGKSQRSPPHEANLKGDSTSKKTFIEGHKFGGLQKLFNSLKISSQNPPLHIWYPSFYLPPISGVLPLIQPCCPPVVRNM